MIIDNPASSGCTPADSVQQAERLAARRPPSVNNLETF
jgi:hypothetical protein